MSKQVSLNALRVLSTVAETHSFKKAALKLGVTQSAVSRQIHTLEEQLGMRLIQRDNRMHALTHAGNLLAPELNRIFSQLEELINTLLENKTADVRSLKIAVATPNLEWFLGPWLADFSSLYPHLKLQFVEAPEYLSETSRDKWQDQLLRNDIDVLISCGRMRNKQINSIRLRPLEFIAAGNSQGPLMSVLGSDDLIALEAHPMEYTDVQQHASTPAALTVSKIQQGMLLIPAHYFQHSAEAGAPGSVPLIQPDSIEAPTDIALQCFTAKHRASELAIVAFSNWLAHCSSQT